MSIKGVKMEWVLLVFVSVVVVYFTTKKSPSKASLNQKQFSTCSSGSNSTPLLRRGRNSTFLNPLLPLCFTKENPQQKQVSYPIGVGSAIFGGWMLFDAIGAFDDSSDIFKSYIYEDATQETSQMAGIVGGVSLAELVEMFDYNANSFDETNSGIFGTNEEAITSYDQLEDNHLFGGSSLFESDDSGIFGDDSSLFDDNTSIFDDSFDSFSSDSF